MSAPHFFTTYEPDPIGVILGTGYCRFRHPEGVSGLAKQTADRLDILAVIASSPGSGQFRRFIEAAQAAFKTVAVWEILNPLVSAALKRYGFTHTTIREDDEETEGWEWSAQSADKTP